jgi:hypothetical protein
VTAKLLIRQGFAERLAHGPKAARERERIFSCAVRGENYRLRSTASCALIIRHSLLIF